MSDLTLAKQLRRQGIRDERVLAAIAALDRSAFVPRSFQGEAAEDVALPIGHGQTITQPWLVAYMTEQLQLAGDERALEVGTGSGYQAAVLGQLCEEVWTLERWPQLFWSARERLHALGLDENTGARHLGEPEGGRAEGWKRFTRTLDGLELSEAEEREAEAGAVAAFERFAHLLQHSYDSAPATV